MKKLTSLSIALLLCLVAGSVIYYGCKKKEETPATTCSDGIQNQGETGVDCGGPCSACPPPPSVICNGNGSASYWPLAAGNNWYLDGTGGNDIDLTVASGVATHNSLTYFVVNENLGGSFELRTAANGDIMRYNPSDNTEYLYIPASPANNQSWTYPMDFSATRKVINTNASVTTSKCSYTGCLQIQHFDASGNPGVTDYYKKGVGMIRTDQIWAGIVISDLAIITLN